MVVTARARRVCVWRLCWLCFHLAKLDVRREFLAPGPPLKLITNAFCPAIFALILLTCRIFSLFLHSLIFISLIPMHAIKENIVCFLHLRGCDVISQQQIVVYVLATCMVFLFTCLHFCNVFEASTFLSRVLSFMAVLCSFIIFIVWQVKNINVKRVFPFVALIVHFLQLLRVVVAIYYMPEEFQLTLVVNSVICFLITCLLSLCYFLVPSIIVGLTNCLVLVYAANVSEDIEMSQFAIVIILMSVFVCSTGYWLGKIIIKLSFDNKSYSNSMTFLLQCIRLNYTEFEAYLSACMGNAHSDNDVDRFFSILSEKSQRNLIKVVERKVAMDTNFKKKLMKMFPNFTKMEIEVSCLIVADNKLSQIANLLGKSEANISVVRFRIRKKLNLQHGEDLREALLSRVKSFRK